MDPSVQQNSVNGAVPETNEDTITVSVTSGKLRSSASSLLPDKNPSFYSQMVNDASKDPKVVDVPSINLRSVQHSRSISMPNGPGEVDNVDINFVESDVSLSPDSFTTSKDDLSDSSSFTSIYNYYYDPPEWGRRPFSEGILEKFRQSLFPTVSSGLVDIETIRKLAWHGIPEIFRPLVWKLLTGYVPHLNLSRHTGHLARKRAEYIHMADSLGAYNPGQLVNGQRPPGFDPTLHHQIVIDIPRTCPGVDLFHIPVIQAMMERILYCWAIRYPASGYVQGLNDILTPILLVYLFEHAQWQLPKGDDLVVHAEAYMERYTRHIWKSLLGPLSEESWSLSVISETDKFDTKQMLLLSKAKLRLANLDSVEADAFWTLMRVLEPIQDHYTLGQPGIMKKMSMLDQILERIQPKLHKHLKDSHVELVQFAYRWINCLLLREVSLKLAVRVWDTCLSEGGFCEYFVFFLASILVSFSQEMLGRHDFQELLIFLQNLPTQSWDTRSISMLCSEAHVWRSINKTQP
jgi:hypothetical protein